MWRLRRAFGWVFAVECFLFALVTWIIHYPPQYGQPFILGGDASPTRMVIEICAFYFAVVFTLAMAWWTIWKERASSRIWGIAASVASLFTYVDPSYGYQIQRRGVWVHWAICLLGLVAFITPQVERPATDTDGELPGDELPNAGICYAFGVLYPVLYLLSVPRAKQNRFLRFHCFQCLFLFAILVPLLSVTSGPVSRVSEIVGPVLFIAWIVAMIQASRRKMFRLPLFGNIADRLA